MGSKVGNTEADIKNIFETVKKMDGSINKISEVIPKMVDSPITIILERINGIIEFTENDIKSVLNKIELALKVMVRFNYIIPRWEGMRLNPGETLIPKTALNVTKKRW
ncbi:MAG: hypothetical protein ACRDDF_12165 [Aeromonas sp.]